MKSKLIFNILGFCAMVLLVGNLIGYFNDNERFTKTFASFLDYLSKFPSLDLNWVIPSLSVDWTGIFKPVADFINLNIRIINFFLFLVEGLLNLCIGALYIFKWLTV